MSILDIGARVITEYKADISDQKAKIKELTGAERELAQAQLEQSTARNEQMEGWKDQLGTMAVSVAAFAVVAKLAFDGYNEKIKASRLETAAAGVDMEALSKAAGGLQTHMELLEFAGRVQTSAFKANNEQLQTAERFMRMLEARGVPTAEAYEAVTNAVTTGRVKGLIPYGIVVNTHLQDLAKLGEENLTLAQKTELVTGAYKAMADATKGVVDGNDNVGDGMRRTQVELANSWEELKEGLGNLVIAFRPLIAILAEAAKGWALLVDAAGSMPAWVGDKLYDLTHGTSAEQNRASLDFYKRLEAEEKKGGILSLSIVAEAEDYDSKLYAQLIALRKKQIDEMGKLEANTVASIPTANTRLSAADIAKDRREAAKLLGKNIPLTEDEKYAIQVARKELFDSMMQPIIEAANAHGNTTSRGPAGALGALADNGDLSQKSLSFTSGSFGTVGIGSQSLDENEAFDKFFQGEGIRLDALDPTKQAAAYDAYNHQRTQTILEKTFGPVGEFDLYKKGFEALSGAVGTAYDAWISGSESAGVAFKKFIGQAVAATGKEMAVEALKEGAYALGSLAFGDVAGASAHGAAAAEFAAGSVLAGLLASELGYGSGGSSKSSSTGGASGGAGGSTSLDSHGQSGGGQVINMYVVGDPVGGVTGSSPRMQQNNFQKIQNLVSGSTGVAFK